MDRSLFITTDLSPEAWERLARKACSMVYYSTRLTQKAIVDILASATQTSRGGDAIAEEAHAKICQRMMEKL